MLMETGGVYHMDNSINGATPIIPRDFWDRWKPTCFGARGLIILFCPKLSACLGPREGRKLIANALANHSLDRKAIIAASWRGFMLTP